MFRLILDGAVIGLVAVFLAALIHGRRRLEQRLAGDELAQAQAAMRAARNGRR